MNRDIKTLLELMLYNKSYFSRGLCSWVDNLYMDNSFNISIEERQKLLDYIKDNRPSKFESVDSFKRIVIFESAYYWEMCKIEPRINWILKHIKIQKEK